MAFTITCSVTASSAAVADFILPAGLSPGDHYRLAFVTVGTHDALSSDFNIYNAFVTSQANLNPDLAALGTTWTAIASTSTVSAIANTGTDPASLVQRPIYGTTGELIAASYNSLWDGNLDNPILHTQSAGSLVTGVWTGTTEFGLPVTSGGGTPLGGPSPLGGLSNQVDFNWTRDFFGDGTIARSMYAMSGDLVVPGSAVPAPPSLLMAVLGVIGMVCGSTRLRRKCSSVRSTHS